MDMRLIGNWRPHVLSRFYLLVAEDGEISLGTLVVTLSQSGERWKSCASPLLALQKIAHELTTPSLYAAVCLLDSRMDHSKIKGHRKHVILLYVGISSLAKCFLSSPFGN